MVPRLHTRTQLVLVVHQLELRKPTNTGSLAARCLIGSRMVVRGARRPAGDAPVSDLPAAWADAAAPLLLFPDRDAVPLEHWRRSPVPVTLVVPDGTWRQAARVRRRIAGLAAIPCVCLPPEPPSLYRLRRARPGRLSTLEAVARALGILEGPEVEARLLHILRVMIDRMLWSNGRLPGPEVTGGIPAGAVCHDPLSGLLAARRPP
jgi:DTW domain-containing protein